MENVPQWLHRWLAHPVEPVGRVLRFVFWLFCPPALCSSAILRRDRALHLPRWTRAVLLRCARPRWVHYRRWLASLEQPPRPPRWARRAMGKPRRRKGIPAHVAGSIGALAYKPQRQGRLARGYWCRGTRLKEPELPLSWVHRLVVGGLVALVAIGLTAAPIAALERGGKALAAPALAIQRSTPTAESAAFGIGDIEVGDSSAPTSVGNQDITTSGDYSGVANGSYAVVIWLLNLETGTATDTVGSSGISSIGYAANLGGSVVTYACGMFDQDATGTSNSSRRMAAATITCPNSAGTGVQLEASFVSFPSANKMRLNWATVDNPHTYRFNFMIITGLAAALVVSDSAKTTAGTKAVTCSGVDLSLNGLVLMAGYNDSTALPNSSVHADLSFGAFNTAGEQCANAYFSLDATSAAAGTRAGRYERVDRCYLSMSGAASSYAEAAFSSVANGSYTLTWSLPSGTPISAVKTISLCMSGIQSKIGSFSSAASPQTVTHNANFTVKGAFFSDATKGAGTSTTLTANWSLGAFDGTNHRSMAVYDLDGGSGGNTVVRAVWSNTKSLCDLNNSGGGAVLQAGTVAFTSTTTMTVTWSAASAGAEWLHILMAPVVGNTHQLVNAG